MNTLEQRRTVFGAPSRILRGAVRRSPFRLSLLAPLSALFLAGTGTTAASTAPPGQVSLDGSGGVRPGMTVPQVQSRWGVTLRLSSAVGQQCESADVRAGATQGFAIFRNRRFRAVFFKQGVRTDKGIRIGSTRGALRQAYASRLASTPDKYTPRARNYYVTRTVRPHWKLRFDVSPRGRVTLIAFGDEQVRLVEGCE